MPDRINLKYEDYVEKIARVFDPDGDPPGEKLLHEAFPAVNTSVADYVWLPLRFEENHVRIDWKDSWRIEDYD